MNKNTENQIRNIYTLDGHVPMGKTIPFGLQHILAMFVANIAPILIVGGACGLSASDITNLVQCAMIIAGIGTLIQLFPLWKIGSGLPIVMGISFTFVGIFCVIGPAYGYGSIIGAILIGGVVEGVLGLFAGYWRKIISPIVAASVVTAIGFSLLSVGASSFGGGSGADDFGSWQNLLLGFITLVCCLHGCRRFLSAKRLWHHRFSAFYALYTGISCRPHPDSHTYFSCLCHRDDRRYIRTCLFRTKPGCDR